MFSFAPGVTVSHVRTRFEYDAEMSDTCRTMNMCTQVFGNNGAAFGRHDIVAVT